MDYTLTRGRFMLPVARWIGHGGETNFQGSSLETFTWATGLAALTKKICLVVTAHTTVVHPVAAVGNLNPPRVNRVYYGG